MRSVLLLALVICTLMVVNGGVVKRSDDVNTDIQTLQTLVQQQAAAISTLQAEVTGLKSSVQTLSKPVAFTAMFSHDENTKGIPLALHQTLLFDHIVTNAGNSYNPTTGIFTSPLAGYYAFSIVMMMPNSADHPSLALGIVKNGAVVDQAWVYNGPDINSEQGSTHAVVHLAPGDQVWIRQNGYGDGVRGGLNTVFTGYLVHAG